MKLRHFIFLGILIPALALSNGETISPNMNLVVPAVGITTGPQWAADEVISYGLIDAHDHSPGKGVPITPAGMNINSVLQFNGNPINALGSATFSAQSSSPSNGSIYESGVDLYYVDGKGNVVRLTQSGSPAGGSGSITGLTSPASASYNSGTSTFVWESDVNTAANLDAGCLLQRDLTSGSNAITLCAPSSLSSNYSLTWPGSLPPAQQFMTLDNSGNIAASWAPDNSTLNVSSNQLEVAPGGITNTQVNSSAGIVGSKLAANLAVTTSLSVGGGNTITPLANTYKTSANNQSFVLSSGTASASGMRIIRGLVAANTGVTSGEGFTVGSATTGIYVVAFTAPGFLDSPSVTVTIADGTETTPTVSAINSSGFTVNIVTLGSTPTLFNAAFSFSAIGAAQ